MNILLRGARKRARTASSESSSPCMSPMPSPPLGRKHGKRCPGLNITRKYHSTENGELSSSCPEYSRQSSLDSTLHVCSCCSEYSRQTSSDSNMSDMSLFGSLGNGNLMDTSDVLMETNQDMDFDLSQELVKKNLQDVTPSLISNLDPTTKFDSQVTVVAGLAYNNIGDLLVSDSQNKKIKTFGADGVLKVECSIPESYGKFEEPAGLCAIKTGEIVVADRAGGNLKVFLREGRYLTRVGRDLKNPHHVTSNSLGHVIVCDQSDVLIYRSLTDKGVLQITKQNADLEIQHGCPTAAAVIKDDEILVLYKDKEILRHFDCFGNYIATYKNDLDMFHNPSINNGSAEACDLEVCSIKTPGGLAGDRENGVLLLDSGHNRVVRFEPRSNGLTKEILNAINNCHSNLNITGLPQQQQFIATSPLGHLAISDPSSAMIKIYKYLE